MNQTARTSMGTRSEDGESPGVERKRAVVPSVGRPPTIPWGRVEPSARTTFVWWGDEEREDTTSIGPLPNRRTPREKTIWNGGRRFCTS